MSSSTRRQQERDNEYSSNIQQQQRQQQQHEATIRSIDMTKDNIRRSIEEVRRETPRYSQTVTDFQNETADASVEIADNFLESQKEIVNSIQSAWAPMAERIGQAAHYWTTGMMPFFSPREMADIYARTVGAMAEAYVASTRMTTNVLFAGLEATRATTNYTRQNAKEAARITSNTARAFAQTARETVQVQEENEQRGELVAAVVLVPSAAVLEEEQPQLLRRGPLILAKAQQELLVLELAPQQRQERSTFPILFPAVQKRIEKSSKKTKKEIVQARSPLT